MVFADGFGSSPSFPQGCRVCYYYSVSRPNGWRCIIIRIKKPRIKKTSINRKKIPTAVPVTPPTIFSMVLLAIFLLSAVVGFVGFLVWSFMWFSQLSAAHSLMQNLVNDLTLPLSLSLLMFILIITIGTGLEDIWRTWEQLRRLQSARSETQAEIFDRWVENNLYRKNIQIYMLAFRFETSTRDDGSMNTFMAKEAVSEAIYQRYEIGQSVAVTYCLDEPRICHLKPPVEG